MKKTTLLFVMLISSFSCFGQETVIYDKYGIKFTYSCRFNGTYKSKDYFFSSGLHTCEQQINIYDVTVRVKNNTPETTNFTNDSFIEFMGEDYKSPDCNGITRAFDAWPMVFLAAGGGVFKDLGAGREYQNTIQVITINKEEPKSPRFKIEPREGPYIKPEWGEWKTLSGTNCNTNIEYQVLHTGNGWGGKTDSFEVKSNNDKTVSFVFQLLDANGRVHFGDTHKVDPGQTIKFEHKMQHDVVIKSIRLDNLVFTTTGKPVCGAAEQEELETLINKKNQLCMELGNLMGNTVNYVYKNNCQQVVTYTVKDLNRLQNEINQLEQELNQEKVASSKRKVEEEKNTQELNEMINEINELCPQLLDLARSTQKVNEVAERDCVQKQYTKDDIRLLKGKLSSVKNEISKLKNGKEEEERKRKEQEAKFNDLITQGDAAYSSKNYDNAMNYYSQAQNIATNDSQKQIASQKYHQAYEGKRTAARADRVTEARRIDKAEDEAYVAMAGTVITAMSFMKDRYTHRGFSGKFQTGLGYNQTPMITNQNNGYAPAASYADKASYLNFDIGLKFEILNNKPVNINVRGLYSIGWHAFEKGVKGLHQVTGVDGGIQFWYKTTTKFKLFADFGWYQREGERTKDQDAVYDDGTSASDDVREGTYKYNVLRLGFGPMLHFRDSGRETWIKPGVYFDKLSFAKEDKPTILYSLNTNINSSIIIDVAYSKNYPVAGTINYPTAFTFANQNYFSFKIIKQGKLW